MNDKANLIKDRLLKELDNARQLGDLRIDGEIVKKAKAKRMSLMRSDVPKAAFDKNGNTLKVPSDLKDEFNIMYLDSNGTNIAANYLLSDFEDIAKPSPSPSDPIIYLKDFWPMLAVGPLFIFAGLHWSVGILIWLGYAAYMHLFTERNFLSAAYNIAIGSSMFWGIIIKLPIFLSLIFIVPGFIASAFLPAWAYYHARKWLAQSSVNTDTDRLKTLFGQSQHLARTGLATQTNLENQMHILARQEQANAAASDISPVFDINATSTGYFTSQGSLNSPDEGKNIMFSGNDLGAAMLVVGTTGTGKTYTVLTPIMHDLAKINAAAKTPEHKYGLLLMDDKGDLPPRGIALFEDFKLISPEPYVDKTTGVVIEPVVFAPMQGLKAEQVAQLIGDIFATSGEIWDKAAQEKFLYTLIIMECALQMGLRQVPKLDKNKNIIEGSVVNISWNLESLFRLVIDDSESTSIRFAIAAMQVELKKEGKLSKHNIHPLIDTAFRYFLENYNKLGESTRSSINFNVSAWYSDSINRYMKPWWLAETGVRIEDIFSGSCMGLYCPEFRYGITGKLISAMVRSRIYNFVKNRTSQWEAGGTRAILMWDEFALGIGKGEMESNILPVQRSLGLSSIFATQTITEVRARMGRERADALLDNLSKNIICLATDAESYKFMADKMGTYRRLIPSSRSKEEPVALDYYGSQCAKNITGSNHTVIYNQDRLEHRIDDKNDKDDRLYDNVRNIDAHIRYLDIGTLSMEVAPIFDDTELSRILKFTFFAFMAVQRGGMQRFEIVKLGPKNKGDING